MVEILEANQSKINDIVAIHNLAFPDFFLTKLGNGFLHLYYKSMIKCKGALTLCAIEDGIVVGFSTTALRSSGFNTQLIRDDIFSFIWESLKLLFIRPMSLIHLIRNLSKTNNEIVDNGEYAELFSIGVSPSCQGKGIGSLLLKKTEILISEKGIKSISLTTDKHDNRDTTSFYHKNGYEVLYEFTTYPNREMIRYIKQL